VVLTWHDLYARYPWRPIRGCPGRFVLAVREPCQSAPAVAFGLDRPERAFDCASARDRVLVVDLAEGGLISYQRDDGSFVHTLNTPEGFARKLAALGIAQS